MWTELLPMMTYCFVMSGTPGPNNVMLASSGALFGFRRTLPQIFGQSTGVALQTYVTCLGLGSLFVEFPVLHQILQIAGALYMVYLAWKLSASSISEARNSKPLTFVEAAMFQAVNPKSWVRSITLATVFMPVGLSTAVGALLVSLVGTMISLPTVSMWALFGVGIRSALHDPRKQRIFNLSMGAMMLVLAISFLR